LNTYCNLQNEEPEQIQMEWHVEQIANGRDSKRSGTTTDCYPVSGTVSVRSLTYSVSTLGYREVGFYCHRLDKWRVQKEKELNDFLRNL
jgi:hypothetical protein